MVASVVSGMAGAGKVSNNSSLHTGPPSLLLLAAWPQISVKKKKKHNKNNNNNKNPLKTPSPLGSEKEMESKGKAPPAGELILVLLSLLRASVS